KLRTEVAAEVMLRNDDASFDLDLRLWLIEDGNQLADRLDVLFHVGDDQRVAASFNFHRTQSRQTTLDDRQQSLIAAATGRIATGATTEAQVGRAACEGAGRTRGLGQSARRPRVVQPDELSHQ